MRTMASAWFLVIVLVTVQKVFGDACLKDIKDLTCNDCIRCGGEWCNERGDQSHHCAFSVEDGLWCPNSKEMLPEIDDLNVAGKMVSPIYAERTLYVDQPDKIDIHHSQSKKKMKLMIHNTTQNFDIELKNETICIEDKCVTSIEATPLKTFCSSASRPDEFVYVRIDLGFSEKVIVKFHVSCACECTSKVERSSKNCNNNGDFSCGVCSCYNGWSGEFCEKSLCGDRRGDLQCTNPAKNDVECSGNGKCGPCETCICYTDREGYQYFDQDNYCADICMTASDCEDCLLNNTIGKCDSCNHRMFMERYNKSVTEIRDYAKRKIWVACNETILECRVDYFARKSDDGSIHVMVERSCNDVDAAAIIGGPQVPIILGVLGLIAAVAAVGGVLLWKHLNTVPPIPLNDPQYQNIDAEDCTGENPLYKPPTSSFKNPTYGKW